jgi:hypothetical protein
LKIKTPYLLLYILLFSCSQHYYKKGNTTIAIHTFNSLQDSAIGKTTKGQFGFNNGWSIYKDIIFAGTNIEGAITKSQSYIPNTTLLNCQITGGDAYNNLFFTYTLAKASSKEKWYFSQANSFVYKLDFFIDNYLNCNYPNSSELEGVEFTFQLAQPPYTFLWGIQWSKSNVWSYWDDTKINGKTKGWINIPGLSYCMQNKQWNTMYITGHNNNSKLYYDSLCLNNHCFVIKKNVPKNLLPVTWVENFLQVGFQINGNKAIRKDHKYGVDPVSVYLNNIQLQINQVAN